MNKKQSAEWYVAGTHWLTSVIFSTILEVVAIFGLTLLTQNQAVIFVGILIFYPLLMWLAVKYSANYVNKRYIIVNPSKIVIFSTLYLLIVVGGYRIYDVLRGNADPLFLPDTIGFLLEFVVFYVASKKYLKANTQ